MEDETVQQISNVSSCSMTDADLQGLSATV